MQSYFIKSLATWIKVIEGRCRPNESPFLVRTPCPPFKTLPRETLHCNMSFSWISCAERSMVHGSETPHDRSGCWTLPLWSKTWWHQPGGIRAFHVHTLEWSLHILTSHVLRLHIFPPSLALHIMIFYGLLAEHPWPPGLLITWGHLQ